MKITKQSLFNKFKSCNDKKSKISFLTKMKNLKSSTKELNHLDINFDNLILAYEDKSPRDYFYKKVFGMTYAEKKAEEEAEYYDLTNGEKVYMKKKPEVTDTIQ